MPKKKLPKREKTFWSNRKVKNQRLKDVLIEEGLSLRCASTLLDMRPYQLRRLLNGEGCTLFTAARIVAALGGQITYEDLLTENERKALPEYTQNFEVA